MNFRPKEGTRYIVLAGNRTLGIRAGEYYRSNGKHLILETGTKVKILGPIKDVLSSGFFQECDAVLSYPLVAKSTDAKGRPLIECYDIPVSDKAAVLKLLWPFGGKRPGLDEERFDLHAGKLFAVREFLVIRETGSNMLVSPFYFESGGTVIDWMPADWAEQSQED